MTEKNYTFGWPDRVDAKLAAFEERLCHLESASEQRRERIGELALSIHTLRRSLDEMKLILARIEMALGSRGEADRPAADR